MLQRKAAGTCGTSAEVVGQRAPPGLRKALFTAIKGQGDDSSEVQGCGESTLQKE